MKSSELIESAIRTTPPERQRELIHNIFMLQLSKTVEKLDKLED